MHSVVNSSRPSVDIDELALTIQNDAPVRFTEEELKSFDERWEKEKGHFFDSVYVRLSYSGPVELDEGQDEKLC